MKIALFISGYLRGIHENIENIKNNIIQNNDCDVYFHITNNENTDKYMNKKITADYIQKIFNPKILIITNNFNFSNNNSINNILNQNYKFYLLNEERKKICQIENINYDAVIKIRPDLNITDKLNYNIDLDYIYIPRDSKIDKNKLKKNDDNFICDILAYGSCQKMNDYFNFYLHLNELIIKYGNVNETLLYWYLNINSIKYILIDINYYVLLSLCNTIAITGDSGTGKTTISNILKELFSDSFVLECDRYHKWERNDENWKKYTHLNPEANYITKMSCDVFDLKIGNSIYQVNYDHESGKFTDKELIESNDNIIVCGLHCLYLPENIINIKIYMDTDENLRIPWKIKRDIQKRGYTIEKIMEQINSRKNDFQKYILPQKEKADIIINFYTNKEFDLNKYNINEKLNVFLKIGVNKIYNINNIIYNLNVKHIENKINFFYFYFDTGNDLDEYKNIIKTILVNMYIPLKNN
jgi:uridine kinase